MIRLFVGWITCIVAVGAALAYFGPAGSPRGQYTHLGIYEPIDWVMLTVGAALIGSLLFIGLLLLVINWQRNAGDV